MGHYYKTIKDNFSAYKNNDKAMWGSIELVDDLLEDIKEVHPDKYWAFMRRTHEMMYGMHFDSAYAEWQVERMYHIGDDGKEYKGERWALADTTAVMQKYRGRFPSDYNEFDFYVALNAQWHDTICTAKRHFASVEDAEAYIIDEAVAVWFNDSDWGSHDKVWRYFRCKT